MYRNNPRFLSTRVEAPPNWEDRYSALQGQINRVVGQTVDPQTLISMTDQMERLIQYVQVKNEENRQLKDLLNQRPPAEDLQLMRSALERMTEDNKQKNQEIYRLNALLRSRPPLWQESEQHQRDQIIALTQRLADRDAEIIFLKSKPQTQPQFDLGVHQQISDLQMKVDESWRKIIDLQRILEQVKREKDQIQSQYNIVNQEYKRTVQSGSNHDECQRELREQKQKYEQRLYDTEQTRGDQRRVEELQRSMKDQDMLIQSLRDQLRKADTSVKLAETVKYVQSDQQAELDAAYRELKQYKRDLKNIIQYSKEQGKVISQLQQELQNKSQAAHNGLNGSQTENLEITKLRDAINNLQQSRQPDDTSRLQRENDNLAALVKGLQEQLKGYNEEVIKQYDTLQKTQRNGDNAKLDETKRELDRRIADQQFENDQLRKALSEQQSQMRDQKDSRDQEIQRDKQRIEADYQNQLRQLEDRLKQKTIIIADLQQQLSDILLKEQQSRKKASEMSGYAGELEAANSHISRLIAKNQDLSEDALKQETQVKSFQQQNFLYNRTQLLKCQNEILNLGQMKQRFQQQVDTENLLRREIETLKRGLSQADQQTRIVQDLHQRLAKLTQDAEYWKQMYQDQDQLIKQNQANINSNKDAQSSLAQLQRDHQTLKELFRKKAEEFGVLEREVASLQQLILNHQRLNSELRTDIQAKEADIVQLLKQIETLEAEIARNKQQLSTVSILEDQLRIVREKVDLQLEELKEWKERCYRIEQRLQEQPGQVRVPLEPYRLKIVEMQRERDQLMVQLQRYQEFQQGVSIKLQSQEREIERLNRRLVDQRMGQRS